MVHKYGNYVQKPKWTARPFSHSGLSFCLALFHIFPLTSSHSFSVTLFANHHISCLLSIPSFLLHLCLSISLYISRFCVLHPSTFNFAFATLHHCLSLSLLKHLIPSFGPLPTLLTLLSSCLCLLSYRLIFLSAKRFKSFLCLLLPLIICYATVCF